MEGDISDVTLWNLFWSAHLIVKIVVVGLLLASVACWAIVVEKLVQFSANRRHMRSFDKAFWSGNSLDDLYQALSQNPASSLGVIFVAAMREWRRSFESNQPALEHLQIRVDRVMAVAISREVNSLERRISLLASVASAAPFIGLFGTVWGILATFQNIAVLNVASLSSIAPGMAEALLATAAGLFAAIPALIAYNRLSQDVLRQTDRLDNFADEFLTLLSRQLDKQPPSASSED